MPIRASVCLAAFKILYNEAQWKVLLLGSLWHFTSYFQQSVIRNVWTCEFWGGIGLAIIIINNYNYFRILKWHMLIRLRKIWDIFKTLNIHCSRAKVFFRIRSENYKLRTGRLSNIKFGMEIRHTWAYYVQNFACKSTYQTFYLYNIDGIYV